MGYRDLAMKLRWEIEHAEHPPGTRLPPIKDIAAQHRTTPTTAMRAIRVLANEGLVDIIHGRGTFFVGADHTTADSAEQRVEHHYRKLIARTPPGTPMPTIFAMVTAYDTDTDTVLAIRHKLITEGLVRPTRWGGFVRT